MQLEGTYTIDLPTQIVWFHILDRAILEEVTPGVQQLKEIEPNHYEALSTIKLGPVKGSFRGSLKIHDIINEKSFVLSLEQQSAIGSANADISVEIAAADHQTRVNYDGDARLTGVLGRLGQRVLGGVVNSLAKQFFSDFESKVKTLLRAQDEPV